jgi:hypothetical protein
MDDGLPQPSAADVTILDLVFILLFLYIKNYFALLLPANHTVDESAVEKLRESNFKLARRSTDRICSEKPVFYASDIQLLINRNMLKISLRNPRIQFSQPDGENLEARVL